MSELPLEPTEPAAPFEFTALDLFGPYDTANQVLEAVEPAGGSGPLCQTEVACACYRNVAVGDLVWLADQNALWGQSRLG